MNSIKWFCFYVFSIAFHLAIGQIGTLDPTFNPGTGPNFGVRTMTIQKDGKILIAGGFTIYNETPINRLARLNKDGSLDTTFNVGTGPSGTVNKIEVLDNGKIFIAGSLASYNNIPSNFIAKINKDGSLDVSFNVVHNSNVSSSASDFHVLPDGKVLLAGALLDFNGTGKNSLVRLNADGSLDESFSTGIGFEAINSSINPALSAMGVQSDGKIIIGGNFIRYDGNAVRFLARLHPDGELDETFNEGGLGANSSVDNIEILANDDIIITGPASYNNQSTNEIALLDKDGLFKRNFESGLAAISDICLLPDSAVFVVGSRTFRGGNNPRSIVLYNLDGTINADFDEGMSVGPNAAVGSCAVQKNGKILIGGGSSFSMYDEQTVTGLVRIDGGDFCSSLENQTEFTQTACDSFELNGSLYTESGTYQQVLLNQFDCDSTLTLHLTIHPSTEATLEATTCDEFLLNGETFFESGTYTQSLTNEFGCDSVLTINLTIVPMNTSINISSSDEIAAELSGATYQWLKCEEDNNFTVLEGATNQSFLPDENGSYAAIIDNGTCIDTTRCLPYDLILNTLATEPETVSLYPNPSKGTNITIDLDQQHSFVEVKIWNLAGKLLQSSTSKNSKVFNAPVPEQPGIYLIEIFTPDKKSRLSKLIKE